MMFKSILTLATFAVGSLSLPTGGDAHQPALVPRQAPGADADGSGVTPNTVLNDIHSISQGVWKLRTDFNAYNGGPLSSTSIPSDFAALHQAHEWGRGHCGGRHHNFTASDSWQIGQYLHSTLGNDLPALFQEIQDKYGQLQTSGEADNVLGQLRWLQYDFGNYVNTLGGKLTNDPVGQDNWAFGVHSHMGQTINAFDNAARQHGGGGYGGGYGGGHGGQYGGRYGGGYGQHG